VAVAASAPPPHLRQLGRFSAARLSNDDHHIVAGNGCQDVCRVRANRQARWVHAGSKSAAAGQLNYRKHVVVLVCGGVVLLLVRVQTGVATHHTITH
jgi:hypothetical protein